MTDPAAGSESRAAAPKVDDDDADVVGALPRDGQLGEQDGRLGARPVHLANLLVALRPGAGT
jgi:hypothetical protein